MDTEWLQGQVQPLAGRVERLRVQSWYEAALDNRDVFEVSLRDSGLSETDVRDALQLRDQVISQIKGIEADEREAWRRLEGSSYLDDPIGPRFEIRKQSAVERLRDWIRGRSFRVEETVDVAFRIPLFLLAAAPVEGCTASFGTKSYFDRNPVWLINVFGTGLGGSTAFRVAASTTFTAASSEHKLVFLPASGTVEKVTWLRRGRPIGQGHRIEAATLQPAGAPGLLLLPNEIQFPVGDVAQTFPLADDTTQAIATYEYAYEHSTSSDLRIGAKAFGIDVTLKAAVERVMGVTLIYGLRGGFEYELRRLSEADGLVWAKPANT